MLDIHAIYVSVLIDDVSETQPCSLGMALALDKNKLVEPLTFWRHCDD